MKHWSGSVLISIILASATGWGTAIALTDSQQANHSLKTTSIGACTVAVPLGQTLDVRATPGGEIIGTIENGTRVVLGLSNGSEPPEWMWIIYSIEGYVWGEYLTNCDYNCSSES
ncbi:MAG: SH3 domain-containing protein [Arthrospira sp. SH-MAG29]|nr:SH3 domain-containing protein [Arthrospira sp. SH-MAG29]MBS0017715.1 SH3 domain-containing protein [Arthrospira sp. SH-MAG29]